MSHSRESQLDAFATQDAAALRAQIDLVHDDPALDPRLRPLLGAVRRALGDVRDEPGLGVALGAFEPILDVLATWPPPLRALAPPVAFATDDADALPWPDRRVLRCAVAFGAVWALSHGPDDDRGRWFAHTAVSLADVGDVRGLVRGMVPMAAPGVALLDFGVRDGEHGDRRLRLSHAAAREDERA